MLFFDDAYLAARGADSLCLCTKLQQFRQPNFRRLVRELRGHGAGVVRARFDLRGRRIVTASRDQTARVWDIAPEDRTPEQLAKLLHDHLPIRFEREGSNVIVPCSSS